VRAAPSKTTPHDLRQLLFLIDTAYDRVSWHGPNLRGSLRGMTPALAAWRPGAGRHNIWELIVHAAYWKYVAWRRLTGAQRGSFPLAGSNFIERPVAPTARALRDDLVLLDAIHATLRAAAAGVRPTELDRGSAQRGVTKRALLTGVAAHDLYHAGQIQLLKRLAKGSSA
jgi:uncharacterized damage-inducible protein DinB